MNRDDSVREALRTRIEWLQILGVSAVAVGSGRQAANEAVAAPAPTAADPAWESEAVEVAVQARGPAASTPFPSAVAAKDPAGLEGLRRIREEIGDCRRCRLCERRTQVVFGVGDPAARLMFIGEGPGADEDAQGEPFVGRAGQLLTKMIEAMGLKRGQVYIANVVKCRPPENRTPLPDEVATCSPFLFRQIAAIAPRVIVCLGTPSAQAVLGTRETITRLRGTFREAGGFRVMPTFHPAYLLRNPAAKKKVWEDLKQMMTALAEA
jgi:uracil-DNA glycosylase family 4